LIEGVDEAEEPFSLAEGVDTLEGAVGFDFGVGDGKRNRRHSHCHRAAVVKVGERLPDPEEVLAEDRLLLKSLELLSGRFLNLAEPVGLLGSRPLAPFQEA
jgi:hypothetical protein